MEKSKENAEVYKRCSCGLTFTKEEWEKLEPGGEQLTEDETGRYRTEYRHCRCGSTIGIETKRTGDDMTPEERQSKLDKIEVLAALDPGPDSPAGRLLRRLCEEIEAYEREHSKLMFCTCGVNLGKVSSEEAQRHMREHLGPEAGHDA